MSWGLISEMGHVTIQTRNLEGSVADATELLGLRVTDSSATEAYLAAAAVHHELRYIASDVDAIHSIGLRAKDGSALRTIRQRVKQCGFDVTTDGRDSEGVHESFSFVGPEGWVFEIYTGMVGDIGATPPFGPDRYGHINFHPYDVNGMKDFFTGILEFRVSDTIGSHAYFLRCNSDHHGIALIKGRGTFHHHAWQVQSVSDLAKLGDRVGAHGRELIWGPVRHGAGHNIAVYYVEASGAVVEVYTDLEQIYNDDRAPVVWDEAANWWNMWGSSRPMDFRDFGIPPAPNRY